MNYCLNLFPILKLLKSLMTLLQILIPIGLLLFGAIDLGKAVIAGKEDEMKKAQGTLIKRVVYAVVVFLLFTIVNLVMGLVGNANIDTNGDYDYAWGDCWTCANSVDDTTYETCLKEKASTRKKG